MIGIMSYWGEIAGLLSAVCAGAGALMARSLGRAIHPVMINAIRCSIAAAGFVLIWMFGSREVGDWLAALPLLFVAVMTGFVIGDSLYLAAITRIGPSRATPIAMSFPLPTAILSVLFLGEAIPPLKALGIAVGVFGIWLIATRGRRPLFPAQAMMEEPAGDRLNGAALAMGASICWAISVVALKPALDLVPLDFANLSRLVFAAIVLSFVARGHVGALRRALESPPRKLVALATGMVSILTAWLLAQCVMISGPSTASLLSSMTPVVTAPLAWLLFREPLTPRLVLGICVGIAAIAMVTLGG